MSGWMDTTAISVLEKGLDASSLRQKVLADNVANVDTPGFKRSDVDFEAILKTAVGEDSSAAVVKDESSSMRADGNNVDIDREMANVAENELYYEGVTQALSSQLEILRMVIRG